MLRLIARSLNILATLALIWAFAWSSPAFSANAASTDAIGYIYDGKTQIAEVIKVGKFLGYGGYGEVYEVTIRYLSNGKEETLAMKTLHSKFSKQEKQELLQHWERMKPVFDADVDKVLSHTETGLRLVYKGKPVPVHDIMLSPLAPGSLLDHKMELKVGDPQMEAKLGVIVKLKRTILKGIELLASHGLISGDIKPANVFFDHVSDNKEQRFDWKHPDPSKIRFMLHDFDVNTPIKQKLLQIDPSLAPPEFWLERTRTASPAYDIYGHAATVYKFAFNRFPFGDYIVSNQAALLRKEARQAFPNREAFEHYGVDYIKDTVYGDPEQYEFYLQWVDQRFRALKIPGLSQSALTKLNEVRRFVLDGLKYSPEERLRAFPDIHGCSIASQLSHQLSGK